jgi:hypothetical protein
MLCRLLSQSGGNSTSVKSCLKRWYLNYYRPDGSRFTSEADCTAYAALGCILTIETVSAANTPVPTGAQPLRRDRRDARFSTIELLSVVDGDRY